MYRINKILSDIVIHRVKCAVKKKNLFHYVYLYLYYELVFYCYTISIHTHTHTHLYVFNILKHIRVCVILYIISIV